MSDIENSGQPQHSFGQVVLPKMLTNTLDQLHDPYVIKDHESRYIYANPATARLAGLGSPRLMIFKRENDFHSPLTENLELVDEWQSQDRQVMKTLKPITMLEIHPKDVEHPYIIRKIPFYDEQARCVGVVAYARSFEHFNLQNFVRVDVPASLLLDKPDDFFTEEECELIFFKLQYMSHIQISIRLGIPCSLVEEITEKLYEKAGVEHIDDFIVFCHKRHYHRYLPATFIRQQKNVFRKNNHFVI